MRRKPQELIAGVLLILSFAFYWPHLANVVPNLRNFFEYQGFFRVFSNMRDFTFVVAEIIFVFVPFVALLAGVLALIGKRKMSSIFVGLSLISMFIASCLTALSWIFAGASSVVGIINILKLAFFGSYGRFLIVSNAENQWFAYAPVAILLIASLVLLLLAGKGKVSSENSFDFQTPAPMPFNPPQPQVAPVTVGMKKCPECAELIQGEAIKCRFCDYRYPKGKSSAK